MASHPLILQQRESAAVHLVRDFLAALDRRQAFPTEYVSPRVTFVPNSDKPTDLSGWQTVVEAWFTAFPNSRHNVEWCESAGDRVYARVRVTGIHRGPLFGVPATNRPIDIVGNLHFTVDGGQIVRAAPVWDMLTLMQQVGAMSMGDA